MVVGLSHKTAPVEFREKLTFPPEVQEEALTRATNYPHVKEAVILSTCNRTEVYSVVADPVKGMDQISDLLATFHELDEVSLRPHLYRVDSTDAIRHLFRVSSSLDSMIIGEAQILGQVKEAYAYAVDCGATGNAMNRLFREALAVGKKVRTETEIGENAVSVSYAAVELAKSVFGSLDGRTVLIVGAGKMSELTARHLTSNGASKVIVASRTFARAHELAEKIGGQAVEFEKALDYLAQADIVISSTAAPRPIITREGMSKAMAARRNRPIFLIDIAVPRDIEPAVNELYNCYLYDIDDLQHVVDSNVAQREKEAAKAEVIIERAVEDFVQWIASLEVVPTIAALKKKAQLICEMELEKALPRLGEIDDRQRNTINALTSGIINKLLHEPIVRIKELSGDKQGYVYTESLRELFGLDEVERSSGG